MFSTLPKTILDFSVTYILSSANSFNLNHSRIKSLGKGSYHRAWPFPEQALVFTCPNYKSFENTVGKGEIALKEQFLFFSVFSTGFKNFLPF